MRSASIGLLVAAVGAVVAPGSAYAASVGGLTARTLAAFSQPVTVAAPTVAGCDNFTGTTGASMSGRAALNASACSGRTWTVHAGTWTIQANQAASNATASAAATLNTSFVDGSAEVTLAGLNTGGRSGGLVASHDGATTYLAAVMVDGTPDRVELRLVASGVSTLLTTVNPTFATTNTLRLTRAGSTITVTLNSTLVLTYTLSAGQSGALGTGSRSGLFGGNASVRFDNFVATVP